MLLIIEKCKKVGCHKSINFITSLFKLIVKTCIRNDILFGDLNWFREISFGI